MLNQKLAVEEKYRARVRELQGKLYELDKDIIIMVYYTANIASLATASFISTNILRLRHVTRSPGFIIRL